MLNCHSAYSLKYGMIDPKDLVSIAMEMRFPKLVLTDINNTSATLSYVREAQDRGGAPVVGADIRVEIDQLYVVIACNNRGFHELNEFISKHLKQGDQFPARAPHLSNCYIVYPWGKEPATLKKNEYIGVLPEQINRFKLYKDKINDRFLALTTMSFRNKQDHNTHRLLRAIDCNTLLSKLPKNQEANPKDRYLSFNEWQTLYAEVSFLTERTIQLISRCTIQFKFGEQAEPQNLKTYTGSKEEDFQLVKQLAADGLDRRYETITDEIIDRIEKEIEIIAEKEYLSYFLIAWDIVNYASSQNYFHVGRGSGANSIIAYLLGITDVDPLELDLYFERFINLYRKTPPDFDIDFSWKDRDDVTCYIFHRFPSACLLCTYNTFQYRATIRELGKVFGLPKSDIDALAEGKRNPIIADEMQHLVVKYSHLIAGLPSHLSVHAGGIIIPEKPVSWYSATFFPPKGYATTQFSMLEAEDVGLYKFDILSQRGLGKICETLEIISKNQVNNPPHDIHDIKKFKEDPKCNQLLQNADALGCFYVESPAMRMLMIKLQTNSYLGLVAASSIIRPGVSSSGMMRQYILRHREPEKHLKEAHPILIEIMPETYGVMVYQEDVIKVAHHYGGLSLAESDVLRRGMSGKFRSRDEFQAVKNLFFSNCKKKGFEEKDVNEIWRQIESFAGYAFAKGHSASYAVESYQSLYLKAYYPLEYMLACINNFGGYYRTEVYVHEARKLGAQIEAPCINNGSYACVIKGKIIFLGFQHVAGLEYKTIEKIENEKSKYGCFDSLEDLLQRVSISLEQLLLLIRVGSLRSFNIEKKALLWQAHFQFNKTKTNTPQALLFSEEKKKFELPALIETRREEAFEHLELIDFPLVSYFELIDETLPSHVCARELHLHIGKTIKTFGYLVTIKRTTTANKQLMLFGTLLDIHGNQMDTVHFPQMAQRYPFQGKGIYELVCKVTSEFDFTTLEVQYLRKIPFCDDPRYTE